RHDLPGAPDGARGARLSLRWPAVLQSARAEARRIARDPGRSTSPRDVSIWARIQWLGAAATATARLIGRREPTESSRLLEQRQGWSLGAPHALSRKADRTGRSSDHGDGGLRARLDARRPRGAPAPAGRRGLTSPAGRLLCLGVSLPTLRLGVSRL